MGSTWRDATALGVLLNTRGLVELVVLNIGLDLGILSPVVFSMLVLMALVTTFMTSPIARGLLRREEASEVVRTFRSAW
jgi:Kef-type K+ transport system membrane component KefB